MALKLSNGRHARCMSTEHGRKGQRKGHCFAVVHVLDFHGIRGKKNRVEDRRGNATHGNPSSQSDQEIAGVSRRSIQFQYDSYTSS